MIYLLDGSNILGHLRLDRDSVESKRALARACGSLARASGAKVICVFDGAVPENFATRLGSVTIRFAAPRSADELIVAEAEGVRGEPVKVVTSDGELAGKVRRRNVEVLSAGEFSRLLEQQPESDRGWAAEDWERYFSDPKNRNL